MYSCRRVIGLAAGAALLVGFAVPASAAEPVPSASGPGPSAAGPGTSAAADANGAIKLAVLDVRVSGNVEARRVEGLTHVLVAEASQVPELEVVTSADIRTLLGFEAERQMLACDADSSCLADIGGALGVPYLVVADVTRIGEAWILTVNLLDVGAARAVKRSSRQVSDETALIQASRDALREALAVIPGLQPASPVATSSPGGRGWLAWTTTGLGAAATLTGAAFYASAWQTKAQWDEDRREHQLTVSDDDARTAELFAPLGLGLAIGGVALVAGSFLLPGPEAPATVVVIPGRRPYAAVTVRFP